MLGTPVDWPDSGEIDVMENVGFEPSTVHGTIHGPGYSLGRAFADSFQRRTPVGLGGRTWVFD